MGTWSIFKKEKSRGIWKPCENFVRQTESSTFDMLSVLYFGFQSDCKCFTNLYDVPDACNKI